MTPETIKSIQTNLDLGIMPSSVQVQQMLDVIKKTQEDNVGPDAFAARRNASWAPAVEDQQKQLIAQLQQELFNSRKKK